MNKLLFSILCLSLSYSIYAQNAPSTLSAGRLISECIMNPNNREFHVQNAHLYDAGGSIGNTSNEYTVNSFIGDGDPLELFFTEFKLPIGAVLNIYSGNTVNGELLGSFTGGDNTKPHNYKSRAFTLEYIPALNGATTSGWRGEIHKITAEYLWEKALLPESDCINAIPICSNSTINTSQNQYEDTGSVNDDTGGCYSGNGQGGSVWYQFTPQATGALDFTISPTGSTDYDFVLWDITNGCNSRTELSCNFAAPTGPTGISSTGDATNSQGSDGTRFNQRVNVDVTRRYAICINYYSGNNDGFTLTFQNNSGSVAVTDNTPPTITNATVNNCTNATTINVFFSEYIDCSTLQNGDFGIAGRTVTIGTTNCTGNPAKTRQITLNVSPALPGPATYTLTGANCNDLCGNPLNQNYSLVLGSVPTANAGPDRISCRSPGFLGIGFTYTTVTLNATGGNIYNWSDGQTGANINITPSSAAALTYTVSVQNNSACFATDQAVIRVENTPLPNLGPTQTVCTGFPVSLASGVSPTGVTFQWQQTTTTNFFGQPNNFTNIAGQTGQNLSITPAASPTFYRVVVTSAGGCQGISTVRINQGSGAFGISTTKAFACQGESVTLTLPASLTSYSWSTGTNANQPLNVTPLATTTFSVTSTTAGCTGSASVTIPVRPAQIASATALPLSPCAGTPVALSGGPSSSAVTVTENFEAVTQSYTLVNGTRNNWFHGTFAFASGSKGLYIGTASTNNNYEIGTAFGSRAATSFAYRDYNVTSFCNPNLSFRWRCSGSSGNAELTVWAITNGAVPSATAGNSLVAGPNTILLSGPLFGQPTTYQTVNLNLTQFAGATVRIVFQWRNVGQNLFGTIPAPANPAASIDDIVFTESTSFTYSWSSSTGVFSSAAQNPTAVPNANTVYTLQATRCDGCTAQASTTVTLCALLGLELTSFDADCDNGSVKINWQSTNDYNVAGYTLQYSNNGIDFNDIDYFKSGLGFYETRVQLNNGESHYFRLKFVGNDGSIEYSDIIQRSCNTGTLGEIILRPNPSSGSVNISFNVPSKAKYRFTVIDLLGRILITKELSLDENQQNILLNTEELSPAVYNLKIEDSNRLYSPKILKFVKK